MQSTVNLETISSVPVTALFDESEKLLSSSMLRQRRDQLLRLFKVLGDKSVVPKEESDPDKSEGYVYS